MAIPKRKIKDSLFIFLFQGKRYLLALYKVLHPEDTTVTEDDIQIVTLNTVLVNGIYNDLGFLVRNNLLILVESQSTWSKNIIYRLFQYAAKTLEEYQESRKEDLYGTKALKLPLLEFYVIYTGDKKVPCELFLADLFKGEERQLKLQAKVISQIENNIIGEYIRFCHIFDEQRKKFGYTPKAIQNAMEICKKENVLMDYLASKESEVAGIMLSLWDEEKAIEIHMQAMEREARERGHQEGLKQGLEQGLEQGIEQGLEQGFEQGIEKGLEQGLVQGIGQGIYEAALRFLKTGKIKLEDILICFPELTTEDIANLKEEIN